MQCVSALSTVRNTEAAFRDVLHRAERGLAGADASEPPGLALVFCSMHHADSLAELSEAARRQGLARHVLGCTAESIIADDHEIEGTAAVGFWTLRHPGLTLHPYHIRFAESEFGGWTGPSERPECLILLADPFTFPTDLFLQRIAEEQPGLRVIGGMASGSQAPGQNRLVLDDQVINEGAVAVAVGGPLAVQSVVSQGCRPIGRTSIVTRTERNVIRELGRRPALEVLRGLFDELSEEDQNRVQQGLHIGRVINEYQETFRRGDFLVRNVIGADDAGGIAITDVVRVGQTVQFHVRDAETADEDLRSLLIQERQAHPHARIGGALVFSCNGRGQRLFTEPDHDIATVHEILGPIPVAGFFAMGEIGPVGGQNFVHGFTASIALFTEPGDKTQPQPPSK